MGNRDLRASSYLGVVDWLKFAGIALIVQGHVAAPLTEWLTPPIYDKQLGVAFFVFAMGVLLARERRPTGWVLGSRLFEVYVYGLAFAVLMSGVGWVSRGDLAESNYLPFAGGINVLFDFFPANPSTWFLGTYLHLLLLWVTLRRVRNWQPVLGFTLAIEVAVRAWVFGHVGGFVAYMLLTNWAGVFVAGLWAGPRVTRAAPRPPSVGRCATWLAALAAWVVVLGAVTRPLVAQATFPFMWLGGRPGAQPALLTSVAVTLWYSGTTWLAAAALRHVAVPPSVQLVARNTLFIFIAHMPVYYALQPLLARLGVPVGASWAILFAACLVGLAAIGEGVRRWLPMDGIKRRALARWEERAGG